MIELGKYLIAIRSAITHTSINGSTELKSCAISNANTMNVNVARDAAPKIAPIATNAKAPGERCADGTSRFTTIANMPPIAALDINIGASNPPEVPEPSEITNAKDLNTAIKISSFNVKLLFKISEIVSYPTPKTRGTKN